MSKKGFWGAIPIILLCTAVGLLAIFGVWCSQNKYVLLISHDSGIYTGAFELSIKTIAPGEIYYTLDGSVPGPENTESLLYEAPILIDFEENDVVHSLQIWCAYEDGTESPVYKREYLLEANGPGRYQTTYVVSVTGDEESLWGYEDGIFVRGRQFDEYMAANPEVDLNNTVIPANYFSDEEVPVHVSVFSNDGTELVSKNCGLRIYGNITRAKNQKSFRLYARDSYDGDNEFHYAFLPKLISEEGGVPVREFQRISFHNSGNDNGYAFNRTALIGSLAADMGYPDVLVSESAVVYVNGKYQGFYWLQNTYDDKYFKEKYGAYTGEMVVCEGSLNEMTSTEPEKAEAVAQYNAFCRWLLNCDIQEDESWQRVCDTIDVENFVQYMAIEYYIGNIDWPHNNVKVYRYLTEEEYEEEGAFDGRFRYLLFDTDYGMGLKFLGWFGDDEYSQRLESLCNVEGEGGIFAKLMQRGEFRNMFVNTVLTMMQEAFSLENVEWTMGQMRSKKDAELHYMYEQTDLMKNSLWESDDISFATIDNEYLKIRNFAERRPQLVRNEMFAVLSMGNSVEIQLSMNGGAGEFSVGDIKVGQDYRGYVFEKYPVKIACELPAGSTVLGYYVGGEYMEGETLTLDITPWIGMEECLWIEPYIETVPTEKLAVYSYDVSGAEDCVILVNAGNVELLLSEYAISDSMDTAKGRLSNATLQPGEFFYIYGKKYSGQMQEKGMQVSFSWSEEEPVVLSNDTDGVVEIR